MRYLLRSSVFTRALALTLAAGCGLEQEGELGSAESGLTSIPLPDIPLPDLPLPITQPEGPSSGRTCLPICRATDHCVTEQGRTRCLPKVVASPSHDLDGDGHSEIVLRHRTNALDDFKVAALQLMRTPDPLTGELLYKLSRFNLANDPLADSRGAMTLADMNDDGKVDYVRMNRTPQRVQIDVSLTNGPGGFGSLKWRALWSHNAPPFHLEDFAGAGNTDGDRKTELFVREARAMTVLQEEDGRYVRRSYEVSGSWELPQHALGDFDGDGITDVLLESTATAGGLEHSYAVVRGGAAAYPLQSFAVSLRPSSNDRVTVEGTVVQIADFDGDKKSDLLVRNPTTVVENRYEIVFMNGTRALITTPVVIPTSGGVMHSADYDRDGKADLFFRTATDTTVVNELFFMNGAEVKDYLVPTQPSDLRPRPLTDPLIGTFFISK
jgi:hypothetical protein